MSQVKSLGLDRVASDVIIKPGLGPMCLSSFETFRRCWLRANLGRRGPRRFDSEASTAGSAAPEPHELPHLVVTTFASLQDWKRCCVCARASSCGDGCPGIRIYSCHNEDSAAAASFAPGPKATDLAFVCTSYATFNARADRFRRQPWGAVILEYSSTIPFPHSYTAQNLLALSCVHWHTVNRPLPAHLMRFDTRWQDLHIEALDVSRAQHANMHSASTNSGTKFDANGFDAYFQAPPAEREEIAAASGKRKSVINAVPLLDSLPPSTAFGSSAAKPRPSVSGTFWSFMEPGVGRDAACEPLECASALLTLFGAWKPTAANGGVRLSCPLFRDGIWYIRAEPCAADREMLRIAAANTPPERHEELYTEYFQTTHCPIDFASLECLICGSSAADVLMSCCASVYHRDCLLSELLCESKCPRCGIEPGGKNSADFAMELEKWLLAPSSYCVVDFGNATVRSHDWSGQLTRQVITSAVQLHLIDWLRLKVPRSYSVRGYTARVHNGQPLTNDIFMETRELPLEAFCNKMPEEIYLFFTVRGTECELKYRNDRERYFVISLVAGIFDGVLPLHGSNADQVATLKYKLLL